MAYQLDDAGAHLLISDEMTADVARLPVAEMDGGEDCGASSPPVAAHDLALLIYTSGSTGKPKGVMLDHSNLIAMAAEMGERVELTSADHSLLVLPLFHVNGICIGTLAPLLAGGRVFVAPGFSASGFFRLVADVRPTYFSAVPATYAMLSALPDAPSADMSSLRFVLCGAAPLAAQLITRVETMWGIKLLEGYGLSEATCASTFNPLSGRRKPGTVGLALPGQQVKIVDPDGDQLPPGEVGEVLIAGPTVMRGYLNRPEATAAALRDGWLHTEISDGSTRAAISAWSAASRT